MTIASQLKAFYTHSDENGREVYDHEGIFAEAEQKAVDTDQDIDNESTTYTFADGSVLVSCNGSYCAYGCKN